MSNLPVPIHSVGSIPLTEPDYADFELAVRKMNGGKLRPQDYQRLHTPGVLEAEFRLKHMADSQLAASNAWGLKLIPIFWETIGEILEHGSEKGKLNAAKLFAQVVLPQQTQRVDATVTLQHNPAEREALSELSQRTAELNARLASLRPGPPRGKVLRGEDTRPNPMPLERPK